MVMPFTILHELGHGLICHLEDNSFEIDIQLFGPSSMVCYGHVTNIAVFHFAGGAFAATIAGIGGIVTRPKFLKIALFSIAIGHLLNAGIEMLFNETYINNGNLWHFVFGLVDTVIFIGVAFILMKKIS